MTTFHMRPPLSVFETNTNISWYLYTQELIQKTTAQATATSGARGAKKKPTAAMNSKFELGHAVSSVICK